MAKNTYQQSMLNKSRADKFLLVFDIPPILKTFNRNWNQDQDNTSIISDTVHTKAFPTTVETIDYNYQISDEVISGFTFVYSQLHTEVINF